MIAQRSAFPAFRIGALLCLLAWAGMSHAQRSVVDLLLAPHRDPFTIHPGLNVTLDLLEDSEGIWLVTDLKMPFGGYVISATCERDYLGQFQLITALGEPLVVSEWSEFPSAALGYEPFDRVMVPMLVESTRVRARLDLSPGADRVDGEVFFVLEPQCVPYGIPFHLSRSSTGFALQADGIQQRWPAAVQ